MADTDDKTSGWDVQADILADLRTGANKGSVIEKYVAAGMPRNTAVQLVDQAHGLYLDEQERGRFREQFGATILLPAIVGGILAAVVTGAIWGAVVLGTHRKFGVMAILVGVLCGYGVVIFARGRRGPLLQGVAVFSSMLGILIGKYVTMFHYLRVKLALDFGPEVAARVSLWSPKVIQFFVHNMNAMLTLTDCAFFVIAMLAAWKIPSESDVVN
jgi:hypothetical protein